MSDLYIYDDIGPDWMGMVSSKTILSELEKVGRGKPVTVRINSPGGDVIEAQAIYNALRRHSDAGGPVTIEIDALAASAASFIAMAGDRIHIAENAMMMIHNAWTVALGNSDQLRSTADVLDKFDGIISATYAKRSNADIQDVVKMMADETWLTASEALDKGFADAVGQSLKIAAAAVKPGRFSRTPDRFIDRADTSPEANMDAGHRLSIIKQKIRLTRVK